MGEQQWEACVNILFRRWEGFSTISFLLVGVRRCSMPARGASFRSRGTGLFFGDPKFPNEKDRCAGDDMFAKVRATRSKTRYVIHTENSLNIVRACEN